MRLSRRSLLKAAARLGAGAGLALLGLGGGERSQAQEESEGPYFRESATKLTLGNQYYEVDFDKQNGAITRIFDKRGGGVVSEGNAHSALWAIVTNGTPGWLGSHQVSQNIFRWRWDDSVNTLHLAYDIRDAAVDIRVTVEVQAHAEPWFDLQANVDYRRGPRIDWLAFLNDLSIPTSEIKEALFPYLPGVMLSKEFFWNRRNYIETYPGKGAFADLTWIDLASGQLACYPIFGESRYWQADIGFRHDHGTATTLWIHRIAAALSAPDVMHTPTIRLVVGEATVAALKLYRQHNRLDLYPSLRERLRDVHNVIRHAPMIEIWPPGSSFASYDGILDALRSPAVLTLPGLAELPFDANLPDALPPGPQFGGAAGFREAFEPRQADGLLLAPYTNPTWANPGTATAEWLDQNGWSLEDVAVRTPEGTVHREHIGDGSPWPGVLLSLADSRVQRRLADLLSNHDAVGSDVILEDQIGARNWLFDYHPEAIRSSVLHYAQSWIDYSKKYHDRPGIAEGGYDRLAETYYGFWWNVHQNKWLSEGPNEGFGMFGGGPVSEWSGYPALAAMLRDRVIHYDHGAYGQPRLAPTPQDELRSFTVALAYGIMPEMKAFDSFNPWIATLAAFTHHGIGSHMDELVKSFHRTDDNTTTTVYETATVIANWNSEPYRLDLHTLAPAGSMFAADDGNTLTGVFRRYNGRDLSSGDHYLVEQRGQSGIIVRQPKGAVTPITIEAQSHWPSDLAVRIRAFHRSGRYLQTQLVRVRRHSIQFVCRSDEIQDAAVREAATAYVELGETSTGDGLREVQQDSYRSESGRRNGRWGRTEIQANAEMIARGEVDPHGWLWLKAERSLDEADASSEFLVRVEYFDGRLETAEWTGWAHIGVQVRLAAGGVQWKWTRLAHDERWRNLEFTVRDPSWIKANEDDWSIGILVNAGVYVGRVSITPIDELERLRVAYYTIHDPTQGETLTQGLHLRGWSDATQPIADLNLDGLQAIYAWDAEASSWLLYSPDVPARFNTIDKLEQGRAYYVRVRNGQNLHWPDAPYGGVGFHLQPGRNLVCWLGTPDKPLTDAIAPLRGMKAEPLVSVQIDGKTYDVEESRSAAEPLPYGQALWVEIDAVGPTRWLQF